MIYMSLADNRVTARVESARQDQSYFMEAFDLIIAYVKE